MTSGKLCLLALTLVVSATAQDSVYLGSISGLVRDASSGVIAGADVTATQTENNFATSGKTDTAGRFRFPYLRLGPYEVRVSSPGFASVARKVVLSVGSTFEIPVTLAGGRLKLHRAYT